jgi:hypothetical protein
VLSISYLLYGKFVITKLWNVIRRTDMAMSRRSNNDLQNSTHKAKYWTTQIPLNTGCDNSRVILLTILVIKHEWWKNSIVIRTVKCWWPQLSHRKHWFSSFLGKLLNRYLQGSYWIDAYKEATESMLTRKLLNRCLQGSYWTNVSWASI